MHIMLNEFDPKLAFGNRLRSLRKSSNLTQEELAEKASLDRTYISSCERGNRNVSLENIYRLSQALGVSPKDLLPDMNEFRDV